MADVFETYLSGTGTTSTDPKELSIFASKLFGPSGADARISEELSADPESTEGLLEYLTSLDVSTHTLAWISALTSASRAIIGNEELLSSDPRIAGTFISRVRDLAQKGAVSHIRYAFHHCISPHNLPLNIFTPLHFFVVAELCRNSAAVAEKTGSEEVRASLLSSLVQALPRVCPNRHVLTPIHGEVMRLSTRGSNKSLAKDIYTEYGARGSYCAFWGRCCPACANEYVRFYYYSGRTAAALGQHREAVRLLRLAVSAPQEVCYGAAEEQVRAYALLTVSLLISEGIFSYDLPPGTTSDAAQRISDACKPYMKLGRAFSKGDVHSLEECIATNSEVWRRDETEELVNDLRASFFRHRIVRFSKVYSSASIDDVARYIGLQEEEEGESEEGNITRTMTVLIMDATSSGVVNAEVDTERGTVTFKEPPARKLDDVDGKISGLVAISGTATRVKHAAIVSDFDETVNRPNASTSTFHSAI